MAEGKLLDDPFDESMGDDSIRTHSNIHDDEEWMKRPFKSSALDAAMQMFSDDDKRTGQHTQRLHGTSFHLVHDEMMTALERPGTVVVSFADSDQLLAVCTAAVQVVLDPRMKGVAERLKIIMPPGCRAKLELLSWMWPRGATMTMEKVNQATSFYSSQITGNVEDVVDSFLPSPLANHVKNGKLDIDTLQKDYDAIQDNEPDKAIAIMSAILRLAQTDLEDSSTEAYTLYYGALDWLKGHCTPPIPTTYKKPAAREFGVMPREIRDLLDVARNHYIPEGGENIELNQRWIHWLEGKSRGTWRRTNKSSRRPDTQPGDLEPGEQPRKHSWTGGDNPIDHIVELGPKLLPTATAKAVSSPMVTEISTATSAWRQQILNRGKFALMVESVEEMYVVLQQIYETLSDYVTPGEQSLELEHLRGKIIQTLQTQTTVPVPRPFVMTQNPEVWKRVQDDIHNILTAWKNNNPAKSTHGWVGAFEAFAQKPEKPYFGSGPDVPLNKLDTRVRSALQKQDIDAVYAEIEVIWKMMTSATATGDDKKFIEKLKDYIKIVLANTKSPLPVPQTYDKTNKHEDWEKENAPSDSRRRYLWTIMSDWYTNYGHNKKVSDFQVFLQNKKVMKWGEKTD
jgi:hypothetical protein